MMRSNSRWRFNGVAFQAYVDQVLVPELKAGDIVVMGIPQSRSIVSVWVISTLDSTSSSTMLVCKKYQRRKFFA
jgi:hypothetical protein